MNPRTPIAPSLCVRLVACALLAACGADEPERPPAAEGSQPDGRATRELVEFGAGQTEAHKIADGVYQAWGVGNTGFVTTSEGNVVIDAGLPTTADAHRDLLRKVDAGPVRYVIATHAHADHAGGVNTWVEDGTEVVVHRTFPETQRYLTELLPFFMQKNQVFYPEDVPLVPGWAAGVLQALYPKVEPTILVDDEYAFELGGVRFEVIHTPGAEGEDSICVWLPEQKILFTGDFFGPLFPMFPNLYTIRGEKFRFAIPYIDSLQRVIDLEPEILVPSHFEPVVGKERIHADLVRTRDAVRYVHDATIEGMNDGKDVYTLMREIRLPKELEVSEGHGKVSWTVRGIWEGYSGWFHFRDTTELYDVPESAVHPEIVAMAGGADAVAARALSHVEKGQPLEALHLAGMALAADDGNRAALEARLAALELLEKRSGGVNHSERMWLRHRIEATREQLGV